MRHAARGRASPVPSARRAVPGALPGREWRVLVSAAAVLTEPLWTVAAARRFPWGFTGFSGALWRWTRRVPRVGGRGRGPDLFLRHVACRWEVASYVSVCPAPHESFPETKSVCFSSSSPKFGDSPPVILNEGFDSCFISEA